MSTTIPEAEPVYQILVNGAPTGPYPLSEVIAGMQSGRFLPEQHAWTEGWPEWRALSELFPDCVPNSVHEFSGETTDRDPLLISALAYPFRGDGIIILIAGTLFFSLLGMGSMVLVRFTGLVGLFCSGYLLITLREIVQASAMGEDKIPAWPTFNPATWVMDFLRPCLNLAGTIFVCLGPGAILLYYNAWSPDSTRAGLAIALLIGGAAYLPMALLAVAMTSSLVGLDPRVVIPSIAAIPFRYAGALLLFAGILVLNLLAQLLVANARLGILSALLNGFFSLYFAVVQARVLGLIYYTSRHRFRWT